MPVGTRGSVKGVLPRDLKEAGSTMILANTLHLHLRPGEDTVERLGGLHRVMNWDAPILTDSGGYQVFSMVDINTIDDQGVRFKSIVDGSIIHFTPARVMEIQAKLGADVVMAFDHCPADPTDRALVASATERTHRWLDQCVGAWRERGGTGSGQALFGIVQGGAFDDLRGASVDAVCAHDLPGYAIGGVSVGEVPEAKRAALDASVPRLPKDKPRYLMGIGTPTDFFDAIERGTDLFDCVTPTRHGRNHQAYTRLGRMNLRNAVWAEDPRPIDPDCGCPACQGFSRGVLRHLACVGEMLAAQLISLHNIWVFHELMEAIRGAIRAGTLPDLKRERAARMAGRVEPD